MISVSLAELTMRDVCGRAVLRPSHIAVCEALLTSRQTLLFVTGRTRHDTGGTTESEHQCGTSSRPWTVATTRRGQRLNVSVVDLAQPPHATDTATATISANDGHCHRYAQFTEPEVVSSSRDRCDEDGRHKLPPLGEAPLYASQTGRIQMVLSSQTTATDKFLLIFTGTVDK